MITLVLFIFFTVYLTNTYIYFNSNPQLLQNWILNMTLVFYFKSTIDVNIIVNHRVCEFILVILMSLDALMVCTHHRQLSGTKIKSH